MKFLVLLILLLLVATAATRAQLDVFNETFTAIQDNLNSVRDGISEVGTKLDQTKDDLSQRISDNIVAVENRVNERFEAIKEDAKSIGYIAIIAICSSLAATIVLTLLLEIGKCYFQRWLKGKKASLGCCGGGIHCCSNKKKTAAVEQHHEKQHLLPHHEAAPQKNHSPPKAHSEKKPKRKSTHG